MKHKLTKNLSLKLLSLVVAFLIWLFVVNVDNPVNSVLFKDVKIQITNEDSVTEIDKVFDIVSDETVIIKVTERQSVLNRLSKDNFTVVADMENLTDMDTVPLTVTCSNPAVTWDEIEISPSSMKVKLEQRKQSEFVVTVSTSGSPERGYEVGTTEVIQGKTVQIAGSESMLNRIGQVVATVNVSGISSNQRLRGELKILDKNGDTLTDAQMSRLQVKDSDGVLLSEDSVLVDVNLWEIMNDVPVTVDVEGTPADGYRLLDVSTLPVTVNVVGTPEALANLNGKIVLKDPISVEGCTESFTQEFDLNDTLADTAELRLVEDAASTVSVSVQIEKTGDYTLTVPLSNLEILNRPEDMSLTVSPADAITIVVHSDENSSPIGISDIKASIDLGVCTEEDTYEIPVEIELPEGYTLASDVSLVVTAERQNQAAEEAKEE
jgi:YbbR domain-containing protein